MNERKIKNPCPPMDNFFHHSIYSLNQFNRNSKIKYFSCNILV